MIVQTTNKPIVIELDEDLSDRDIHAGLYDKEGNELASWFWNDMIFHDNVIELPLREDQTAKFPPGFVTLEIKWLNLENKTEFIEPIVDLVVKRRDKGIFHGEEG